MALRGRRRFHVDGLGGPSYRMSGLAVRPPRLALRLPWALEYNAFGVGGWLHVPLATQGGGYHAPADSNDATSPHPLLAASVGRFRSFPSRLGRLSWRPGNLDLVKMGHLRGFCGCLGKTSICRAIQGPLIGVERAGADVVSSGFNSNVVAYTQGFTSIRTKPHIRETAQNASDPWLSASDPAEPTTVSSLPIESDDHFE
jgi:hypothetical protein